MVFVVLKKKGVCWRGVTPILFPPMAIVCEGWVQTLRLPGKAAVPVFDGRVADDFDEQDENFVKRWV